LISAESRASEISSTAANANQEVIIERDVSNTAPVWCGSKHAFFYSNDKGTFLYDIPKKSKTKVSGYGGWLLGCTPDGEWYIYMDKARVRYDKKDKSKGVVDIWRLKLGTNTRQKIAILYDDIYGEIIFPEGKTVLVGKQPNSRTAMPEPQWDTYISDNEWLPGNARWFRDASGAAATYQGEIALELFSPERRTILFDPFLGEMNIRLIRVDNRNRAYVLAREKGYQRKTKLF